MGAFPQSTGRSLVRIQLGIKKPPYSVTKREAVIAIEVAVLPLMSFSEALVKPRASLMPKRFANAPAPVEIDQLEKNSKPPGTC